MNEVQSTAKIADAPRNDGIYVYPDRIEAFLGDLQKKVKCMETVKLYTRSLKELYQRLPDNHVLTRNLLTDWREEMLAGGMAPGTANGRISAANSFVEYCGRRDLQLIGQLPQRQTISQELTRSEYQRLLSTARILNDQKAYFAIKIFGDTGLRVQDLPKVTVEAVQAGQIVFEPRRAGGKKEILRFPKCLRQELLDYARRTGRASGPILAQKSGKPLARSHANELVRRICREARVPEEKATPSCLRDLYRRTMEGIESDIGTLIEMAYERLLDKEQLTVGWDN